MFLSMGYNRLSTHISQKYADTRTDILHTRTHTHSHTYLPHIYAKPISQDVRQMRALCMHPDASVASPYPFKCTTSSSTCRGVYVCTHRMLPIAICIYAKLAADNAVCRRYQLGCRRRSRTRTHALHYREPINTLITKS